MDVPAALAYVEAMPDPRPGELATFATASAARSLAGEVRRLTEQGSALYNEGYRQGRQDSSMAPNRLDLASTRELLEELRARGETADEQPWAWKLRRDTKGLLGELPDALLDYRTVEA